MGSIPDAAEPTQPSFDEFQKQTSLMTSCTLLWKELSDHFTNLEEDLRRKSEALKRKIQSLDDQTKTSLDNLKKREKTIESSVDVAIRKAELAKTSALRLFRGETENDSGDILEVKFGEVDDSEGMLNKLKEYCTWMDYKEFWKFITVRKKELDLLRSKIPIALLECVDPPKFVLEAMSEVFPMDKKRTSSENANDLGWACVLLLESLIPVVVDPILGTERLLVTPSVRRRAEGIAETWKKSLAERGGIENVKTPDVHTFLQHLVTFGIVKKNDVDLYRKLVVASAWRKQMPKLALSLGLSDNMPDMIEELICKGQQVDAVHFTYEVGLVDRFPPVPLLKAFLKDAKKAATAILEDPNNSGRAAHLANRKEQSALRAVLKCIEEYKLEDEFPSESLKRRLDQLEKTKFDKKRTSPTTANKRTRVCNNNGPMPPAKAGRLTNAYVSSFPPAPSFMMSPSHQQYPAGPTPYTYDRPTPMYGTTSPSYSPSYSPTYHYSPEAVAAPVMGGPYSGGPINYPAYCYSNGMSPSYPQAYYG